MGLGVEGLAVLLLDAQGGQQVFEGVAGGAGAGGEDEPVIGQGGGWWPVGGDVRGEAVHDKCGGDAAVGGGGEQ